MLPLNPSERARKGYFSVCLLFVLFLFVTVSLSPAGAKELKTEFQDTSPKYIQAESGFEGICVDIMHALQKRMDTHGIDIVFPGNFTPPKRIRTNLADGLTDIHCGAARSKKREKFSCFQNSHSIQLIR